MTDQAFLSFMGSQIRNMRKKAGLTQIEVAKKANVTQSTLSRFESTGEGVTGIEIIKRIVESTGHVMGDLFQESPEKKTTFTGSSLNLCPS